MTLKERLKEEPIVLYKDSYNMTNQSAESLEVIADEYAIEFKDWCNINEPKYKAGHLFEGFNPPTTEELLEIYKKEIGL